MGLAVLLLLVFWLTSVDGMRTEADVEQTTKKNNTREEKEKQEEEEEKVEGAAGG